ncbi:hypothetical protein IMZ48_47415 [Candidatus Bathyarchaeota archaeon]|nr:hypothetical protein [Candidatus Bathyarchaeota archaeon]
MASQNHYQQASYASGPGMSHPSPPGSPTLTNPDMILPDDGFDLSPDRSPSPPRMWKGPLSIDDMQYHIPSQSSFDTTPTTPVTPIIYGNGTMLSDIGEVTEVESNVGGPAYRRSLGPFYHHGPSDTALGSSPTMGTPGGHSAAAMRRTVIKKRPRTAAHERNDSIESTSTITSRGRPAPFADFDDTMSVDDSVFQGDDEESVAESFADDVSVHSNSHIRGNGGGLNDENRFSTSSIGRHAELILANAKKRLTVC